MLAAEIAIFSILSVLFLIVGCVIGWLIRNYLYEIHYERVYVHPEMFDSNGNLIPDEILAVRFETDYDNSNDDDEEENN